MRMVTYWVPKTAREAREWLISRYPNDVTKYRKAKKDQLYAIYHSIRKGEL